MCRAHLFQDLEQITLQTLGHGFPNHRNWPLFVGAYAGWQPKRGAGKPFGVVRTPTREGLGADRQDETWEMRKVLSRIRIDPARHGSVLNAIVITPRTAASSAAVADLIVSDDMSWIS